VKEQAVGAGGHVVNHAVVHVVLAAVLLGGAATPLVADFAGEPVQTDGGRAEALYRM